ncbi:hypothetical protein [Rhodanobacter sp. BL-MT-08]
MTEAHEEALARELQVQSFLHDLERLGLAEPAAVPDAATNRETTRPTATTTFDLLRSLGEHFGYRID